MERRVMGVLLFAALCQGAHASNPAGEHACAALTRETFPTVASLNAHPVPAGNFRAPDGSSRPVPAFCRVAGILNPSPQSRIIFELWLPVSNWNGRYYQLGTGGFAGGLPYAALAAELARGNAVAATDTGHQASPFDASWAVGAPARVVDYGFRSIDATARAAGGVIAQFYGKTAHHRYFAGCSNGGRQAMMAAQRSAQLWDGILAGAPAFNWTRQLATFAWIQRRLRRSPATWISPRKLPAIQSAALASCSPQAGVIGAVAADPRQCPFDPNILLCKAQETDACLTEQQVGSLQTLLEGPSEPNSGSPIYFGFEPTSAAAADNWERWIVNSNPDADSQLKFAEQFYRYLVDCNSHL